MGMAKLGLAFVQYLADSDPPSPTFGHARTGVRAAHPRRLQHTRRCVLLVDAICSPVTDPIIMTPKAVPVMPLAGVLLFPHALLPPYLFEPRHREMLEPTRSRRPAALCRPR